MPALDGRVVLVTGASRRIAIGAGVARRLVADGATVLLHSWSPHDAEQPWGADEGGVEALSAHSPGGRWSTPADTARLIAWLLSDEADCVTGQTIASDGGFSSL